MPGKNVFKITPTEYYLFRFKWKKMMGDLTKQQYNTATTAIATAEAAEKIGQVITMETYNDCMENPKTCVFIGFGNEQTKQRTNKRPNNLDAAAVSRTFEQYKGQGGRGGILKWKSFGHTKHLST